MKSSAAQTDPELFDFVEMEVQTGSGTDFLQNEVNKRDENQSLRENILLLSKRDEKWVENAILSGFVSVDFEVCYDPDFKLPAETIVSLLLYKQDVGVQTICASDRDEGKESISYDERKLSRFLASVSPSIEKFLGYNLQSRAFEGYELFSSNIGEDIHLWKVLSVDLAKYHVILPDWSSAKHRPGKIVRCMLTRTKERVYDIEFEDGNIIQNVREEHIRMLEDGKLTERKLAMKGNVRYQEGIRVHARVQFKSGNVKYLPGRIIKLGRGSVYDVECEGGKKISGLTSDDLLVGVEVNQSVEARRPKMIPLQATGISWNSTGSSVAVSYGRQDLTGWCDFPGAVCIWNVFGKSFNSMEPDYVLDHSTCLMCVQFHPENPSMIAAASYNGEVLCWDLNVPDSVWAMSSSSEYTHQEPILNLRWIFDPFHRSWLLFSVGLDGKLLQWEAAANGFRYPVKGHSLNNGKVGKRVFPSYHGGASFAMTSSSDGSQRRNFSQWMIVGLEGGAILRTQGSRLFEGSLLRKESFRSHPSVEEVYSSLKKSSDNFSYEPHIGCVNSVDNSPFHRHLFLTGGADGSVRLYHVLESAPLLSWEPSPPPATLGASSTLAAITCVRFSPNKPSVFAASSSDGFLYIFDLSFSLSSPAAILEVTLDDGLATNKGMNSGNSGSSGKGDSKRGKMNSLGNNHGRVHRVSITSLSFNQKQRDLLAACDLEGQVHIWKLSWKLANRETADLKLLQNLANINQEIEED